MGLSEVVADVRRDGEENAQAVLRQARQEADAILQEARRKAKAYEEDRLAHAARDGNHGAAQVQSRADSDARRAVLAAEAQLRSELKAAVLRHFRGLPPKARQAHLKTLVERAHAVIPKGRVWGAEADAGALQKDKTYAYAGTVPAAGGIVVESEDGTVRLDLTYETLLEDLWRDVLKAEAALFR